jgi:transcription elongation factor Elf1
MLDNNTVEIRTLKAKYLNNPDNCPRCGCQLGYRPPYVTVTGTYKSTYCENCGVEFTEIYTLTDVNVDALPALKGIE